MCLQVGRELRRGIGSLGREPESSNELAGGDGIGDLGGPRGAVALDASVHGVAQSRRHRPTGIVLGDRVGLGDQRPKVAHGGRRARRQSGFGPITPVGGAGLRKKILGQRQECGTRHLWFAGGAAGGVLIDDRLADSRNTATEQLIGDHALLGGEGVDQGVAVGASGREALRTVGALGPCGADGTIGAVSALGSVRTVGALGTRWPRWSFGPAAVAGRTIARRAIRAGSTVGARPAALAVVAATATALCVLDAHLGTVGLLGADLDGLGLGHAGVAGRDDRHDLQSVEEPLGLGANDVADPGAGIQDR